MITSRKNGLHIRCRDFVGIQGNEAAMLRPHLNYIQGHIKRVDYLLRDISMLKVSRKHLKKWQTSDYK